MKRDNSTFAIAVIMIAIVVIGGVSIYYINPYSYDANVIINDDGAEYSIDVSNNIEYNILVLDNFDVPPIESLIICSDGSSYPERVKAQLGIRGFDNVDIKDPEDLLDAMSGDPSGRGILILHQPFPEEIYSGDENDPLITWLGAGGSVYWIGYLPGGDYVMSDSSRVSAEDYLSPFDLSRDSFCIVPDGNISCSGDLCVQLCFRDIDVMDGLRIDIGRPISYISDSGYSAITAMKVLKGNMVVLGGVQTNENAMDIAQVIASGITYNSELIGYDSGFVKNNTDDLITYTSSGKENVSVYVHVGGYYTAYGERFNA